MQTYRYIQEIGTTCAKDTCLQIPLAALDLRSRSLGNSPPARSLLDDRHARNKQYTQASRVPTVGEGGWCGAGGRPATVDRNGGGLELGVGRVEARRGEIESGTG
jgi:hypothetical protein